MESDTFKAGVAPGAPGTLNEVKTLLCVATAPLEEPLDFALLHEAMSEHALINYFALVEALDQLVESGHFLASAGPDGGQRYAVTDTGRSAAAELGPALPPAVRDKAVKAVRLAVSRERRKAEVSIREERSGEGYLLELAIPDGDTELVSVTVFAPTREQRNTIRRRFLNDPVFIYQRILMLLTGDKDIVGELLEPQEPLFGEAVE